MIRNKIKAETFVSLLVVLTLFALIWLSYTAWLQTQSQKQSQLYQEQQALQIVENQLALQMVGMTCESQVQQNQLVFHIQCSSNVITVKYPQGQVTIKKSNSKTN